MNNPARLEHEINQAQDQRAMYSRRAMKIAQIGLVLLGGVVAAIGALGAGSFTWPPSGWFVISCFGLLMGLLGSSILAVFTDTSDHLDKATRALQLAREAEAAANNQNLDLDYFEDATTQLRSLYLIHSLARSFLESSLSEGKTDEKTLIEAILKAVRHDLRVALGFAINDTWTIVVYERYQPVKDSTHYLRCIAHDRSVDCEIKDAREWKEGIGVAGMALLRDDELVAPDILHPTARSLFRLTNGTFRELDLVRYRSMMAVPINVGSDEKPWGVVLASSNRADHFVAGGVDATTELAPNEAMRAFTGVVALAVASCRVSTNRDAPNPQGPQE